MKMDINFSSMSKNNSDIRNDDKSKLFFQEDIRYNDNLCNQRSIQVTKSNKESNSKKDYCIR